MKHANFEDSNYFNLFVDKELLNVLVNDTKIIQSNFNWWESQFLVDSAPTPRDDKGVASFTMAMAERTPSKMMDMRAPLGKGKSAEVEGFEAYSATIPDFIAPVIEEQAFERAYREKLYAQLGTDASMILDWSRKLQRQVDSANQTLTNMGAQLISTGEIKYDKGRGIKGNLYKVSIPTENFTHARSAAWTDPECPILDEMAAIEYEYRNKWATDMAMVWQMPYKMFTENFLKNTQVKQFIKDYRTNNDLATTDGFIATEEYVKEVLKLYPAISPIEVVRETQFDYTGDVNGWKDGVAVLRPSGYAGVIKHAIPLDVEMFGNYSATTIRKIFAGMGTGGIMKVANTTSNAGEFLRWTTELMLSAIPALDEFIYHVIVDVTSTE